MIDDLQKLFLEVADLDSEGRSKYFDQNQIPSNLRVEVESLLRFDHGSSEMLRDAVGGTVDRFLDSVPEKYCGPYELIRPLGTGGMGSVYLAQRKDGEVNLQVAIKLINGTDNARIFRERFLRERQILASLNHPGITRLLDVGHTRLGQPYLVMEYVDGTPIDVYCANLPFEETIKLYLAVCEAIAYLHRNLVIHRDLKPSNVLVERRGSPKVLDFGIAKILDDSSNDGVTKERMLTPDYASPEQVKGSAKTTATDVYSLGAMLYGLFAGRSPHRTTGGGSIEEAICIADPVPLSRLNPTLPSDLEFVVRKALRKEPSERYPTVDAFADDLKAVLESRPIRARSDDLWYKVRKFARRNWLPASAAAAIILSLGTGLYIANRERATAQRRFSQLRQLSNRILALDGELRGLPGSTKAREQIVTVSMEYLDGLSLEARNDLDLKLDVANGYMTTAQLQGVPVAPSLGHFKEADASLAKAAGLVESVLAAAPARSDALLLGGEIEQDRMIVADTLGERPQTLDHANRGAAYVDRGMKVAGLTAEQKKDFARLYINIGQGLMNVHRYQEAASEIRRGVDAARAAGSSSGMIAQGLSGLANAQRQAGDLDGALASITEARALSEKAVFPNDMLRASTLYAILWRQGMILGADESINLGRAADAIAPLQEAFDLVDREASKDPVDVSFRERLGTAGRQLGDVLRHTDPARALAIYDRTLARLREAKDNTSARRHEARVLAHSSYPLRILRRPDEAKKRIDDAFALLRPMGESPAVVGILGGEWDDAFRAAADQEFDTGNPEKARTILLDLESKLMAQHPAPETDLLHAADLSRLYDSVALVDSKLRRYDEAAKYQGLRLDLWRLWDRKLPGNSFIHRQMEKPLLDLPLHPAK